MCFYLAGAQVCELFLSMKFWVGSVVFLSGHRDVAASFNFIDDNCMSSSLYGQVHASVPCPPPTTLPASPSV